MPCPSLLIKSMIPWGIKVNKQSNIKDQLSIIKECLLGYLDIRFRPIVVPKAAVKHIDPVRIP